jgi:hypothetical protein
MDTTLRLFSLPAGTLSDFVLALSAIIAGIFAYHAWSISKGQLKNQIVSELLKEYRSPEMGMAIRRLYEEFHTCQENQEQLIERYQSVYRNERDNLNGLHYQRRKVSIFYQHISTLITNGIIGNTIFYSLWTKDDLKIIPDILIPIETKAIPLSVGKIEISPWNMPRAFTSMLDLYKNAPNV